MTGFTNSILKLIRMGCALFLILLGLLILPLPIPLGAILIIAGFCWLVLESRRLQSYVRIWRGQATWFNTLFIKAEPYLPGKLKAIDHATRPQQR